MDTKQLYFRFTSLALQNNQQSSKQAQPAPKYQQAQAQEDSEAKQKSFAITATDDNKLCQTIQKEDNPAQLWYLIPNFTQQSQSGFSIINKKTGMAIKYASQNKEVHLAENEFGNEDFVWQIQSYSMHQWQIFFQDSDYCLTVKDYETPEYSSVICKQNQDQENQEFLITLAEIDVVHETQQTHVSVNI